MKNKDMLGTTLLLAGGVILAPIVIGAIATTVAYTYGVAAVGVEKIKFNRKIKKGLKDGSIVEIDGKYFEVGIGEEA